MKFIEAVAECFKGNHCCLSSNLSGEYLTYDDNKLQWFNKKTNLPFENGANIVSVDWWMEQNHDFVKYEPSICHMMFLLGRLYKHSTCDNNEIVILAVNNKFQITFYGTCLSFILNTNVEVLSFLNTNQYRLVEKTA